MEVFSVKIASEIVLFALFLKKCGQKVKIFQKKLASKKYLH